MVNTPPKLNRCRVCFSSGHRALFTKEGYEISKCTSCNFIFLNFNPESNFFTSYYSADFFNDPGIKHGFSNYEKEINSLNKSFNERIKAIRKYQQHGFLLDIGCATGIFMEAAASHWDVRGIEVSAYACELAQKKNLEVFCGKAQDSPYANHTFNVITLWDTIEHLSDPLETMQHVSRMLVPGGIVALTTGDVSSLVSKVSGRMWHLYNIPQHLSYFDKKTITDLLGRCGFMVREITYPSVHFTLDYLLFRLMTFYKLRFALPLFNQLSLKGILNISLGINLRDIMFLIAEKR